MFETSDEKDAFKGIILCTICEVLALLFFVAINSWSSYRYTHSGNPEFLHFRLYGLKNCNPAGFIILQKK